MTRYRDHWLLVGRVLLAVIFVYGGCSKIGAFEATAGYIAAAHLPLPQLGVVIAIVIELGGGVLLALGWKTRCAALAIAVLTVAASVIFHDFWNHTGGEALNNRIHFLKNVAIIGGLLIVAVVGPGRLSVDRS